MSSGESALMQKNIKDVSYKPPLLILVVSKISTARGILLREMRERIKATYKKGPKCISLPELKAYS